LETNKELKINFYNGIRNDTYFVENWSEEFGQSIPSFFFFIEKFIISKLRMPNEVIEVKKIIKFLTFS
jgi:hypothetical protein